MIQRKQTLFLLIFAVLFILMFIMPLASVSFGIGSLLVSSITPIGITNFVGDYVQYSYTFTAFLAIMIMLPIATIFLYKKRVLQMRLITILMILTVAFMAYEWYYIADFYGNVSSLLEQMSIADTSLSMTTFLPVPALVLAFLAFKGVAHDEMIVRSFNRMR